MLSFLTRSLSELWISPDDTSVFRISEQPTLREIDYGLEKLRENPNTKSLEVINVSVWEKGKKHIVVAKTPIDFHHFFSLSNLCRLPHLTRLVLKAIPVTEALLTSICTRYPSIQTLILERCEIKVGILANALKKLERVRSIEILDCFTDNKDDSFCLPRLLPPKTVEHFRVKKFLFTPLLFHERSPITYHWCGAPTRFCSASRKLENLHSLTFNVEETPQGVENIALCIETFSMLNFLEVDLESSLETGLVNMSGRGINLDPVMNALANPDLMLSYVKIKVCKVYFPETGVAESALCRMLQTNTNLHTLIFDAKLYYWPSPDNFLIYSQMVARHPTLEQFGVFRSISGWRVLSNYVKRFHAIFDTNTHLQRISGPKTEDDIFEPIAQRNRTIHPSLFDRLVQSLNLYEEHFSYPPAFKFLRSF